MEPTEKGRARKEEEVHGVSELGGYAEAEMPVLKAFQ